MNAVNVSHSCSNAATHRLIRLSEVIELTGLSKSYVYALAAKGRFPKSISLVAGGTSRAWIYAEVSDWINQRILARTQEVANG